MGSNEGPLDVERHPPATRRPVGHSGDYQRAGVGIPSVDAGMACSPQRDGGAERRGTQRTATQWPKCDYDHVNSYLV